MSEEFKEPDLTYVYGAAVAVIAFILLLAATIGRSPDTGPTDALVEETTVEETWTPGKERKDNTNEIIRRQLGAPPF